MRSIIRKDDMRDMAKEYKTGLRTFWEVNDVLGEMESRAAKDKAKAAWQVHREDGEKKKPTRAAVISAMILRLAEMPEEHQDAFIADGMRLLNGLIQDRPEQMKKPLFDASVPAREEPSSPPSKKTRRA